MKSLGDGRVRMDVRGRARGTDRNTRMDTQVWGRVRAGVRDGSVREHVWRRTLGDEYKGSRDGSARGTDECPGMDEPSHHDADAMQYS